MQRWLVVQHELMPELRLEGFADTVVTALANAVRVANDILTWQTMIRNRRTYGDRQWSDVNIGTDLGERIREPGGMIVQMPPAN